RRVGYLCSHRRDEVATVTQRKMIDLRRARIDLDQQGAAGPLLEDEVETAKPRHSEYADNIARSREHALMLDDTDHRRLTGWPATGDHLNRDRGDHFAIPARDRAISVVTGHEALRADDRRDTR